MTRQLNVIAIYDDPEYVDRYTIVTDGSNDGGKSTLYLSLSDNCNSPMGFSQFGECPVKNHTGKRIAWTDMPQHVRDHATARLDYPHLR